MRLATAPDAERAAVICCGSAGLKMLWVVSSLTDPSTASWSRTDVAVGWGCPGRSAEAGIALVPESRKEQGIVAECSVSENANLSRLAAASQRWLRNRQEEQALSRSYISALRVRCSGIDQPVQALSGGNQQKVVLARCLATNPRVLLLDEPTRGVDVGARREIYSLLFELAAKGLAILFVSSELEEVLGISDRVIVMGEGEIRGELQRSEFSEHAIMSLASPHSRKAA